MTTRMKMSRSKAAIDSIWNNPDHLDLLEIKKSSLIPITQNLNPFLQVLPCLRRLYTIFDSICPNLYRIHCSNSLRIFKEICCLTDEYLHVIPSSTIPAEEFLYNEKYLEEFIALLRRPSIMRQKSFPSIKDEFHCFGQGIQPFNTFNQLHRTIVFCFELTTKDVSLPIDVLVHDPNESLVLTDVKYISTYHPSDRKLFSCSYTPITQAGIYKISFVSDNTPLSNQSYSVYIHQSTREQLIPEPSAEIPEYGLEGEGCSTKIILNSIARFRLRVKSSNHPSSIIDLFVIEILDPYGHRIVVQRRLLAPDLLELTYQPMSIGEYQLTIRFDQQIHRQMTIDVINDEANSLSKLKPFGPGLQRAIVGLPTEFYVDLNRTTSENIHFRLEPSYQAEIDFEQQLATVRYVPSEEGICPVHILENDREISSSPFLAHVEKKSIGNEQPRIRVVGLSKKLILHRPVEFQVFVDNPFDDSTNSLHIDIITDDDHSPSISIRRRSRSTYFCSFIPVTLGKYIISIDYAGLVAEHNPFHCQASQEKDILLTGPAIHNSCLPLNEPTHFCFALKDFLPASFPDSHTNSESGYSSNDDISSKSSSSTDLPTSTSEEDMNYRVTITDGHGNIKPNVLVNELLDGKTEKNIRVDFTPEEKILYINISCTW